MGRRQKGDTRPRKTERIITLLSPEEIITLDKLAAKAMLNRSAYLRWLIRKAQKEAGL